MKKSPAFQYYPDKWQTDTRRLSWGAKGIYHELICVVWIQFQNTCSIPNDDDFISGEIGCSLAEWQACKAELMNPNRPILTMTETNRLFIAGLHKEAVKQADRREQLRQNGLKGGRPKNQKVIFTKPEAKPDSANQKQSLPSPSPSPSPSIEDKTNGLRPVAFYNGRLSPNQAQIAERFEKALGNQWDDGNGRKWKKRSRIYQAKAERVVAELESAAKESRIKTSPAQYAEQIWKEFK